MWKVLYKNNLHFVVIFYTKIKSMDVVTQLKRSTVVFFLKVLHVLLLAKLNEAHISKCYHFRPLYLHWPSLDTDLHLLRYFQHCCRKEYCCSASPGTVRIRKRKNRGEVSRFVQVPSYLYPAKNKEFLELLYKENY